MDKIIPQLDRVYDCAHRSTFMVLAVGSVLVRSNMQQLLGTIPCRKRLYQSCRRSQDCRNGLNYGRGLCCRSSCQRQSTHGRIPFRRKLLHSSIAKTVFRLPCEVDEAAELYTTQRQAAKAVTFGIMYGAGPKKISEQVTKDSGKYFSQQEAKEVIDDYFQSFHALKKWINDNHRFIEQNGFVYSFFGRKKEITQCQIVRRGHQES